MQEQINKVKKSKLKPLQYKKSDKSKNPKTMFKTIHNVGKTNNKKNQPIKSLFLKKLLKTLRLESIYSRLIINVEVETIFVSTCKISEIT